MQSPADPGCRNSKKKIGILAYGSLITDPGAELLPLIRFRIKTETPFPVEYGRISQSRGGAPTLVPHPAGATVHAEILVLDDSISIEQARDIMFRREIHRVGSDRVYTPSEDPNRVQIRTYTDCPWVEAVLYTDFNDGGKISAPIATELARAAIGSVRQAREAEQDGISYLIQARNSGIDTPITKAYVEAILRQTGAGSLSEALDASHRQVGNPRSIL